MPEDAGMPCCKDRSCTARPQAGRGFTLVELIVTVTILAVLMAFAGPAMVDFVAARAAEAQAEELVSSLRQARSEAMKRRVEVTLCAGKDLEDSKAACSGSKDWSGGWVSFVDYDADATRDDNEGLVRVVTGQSGLKSNNASAQSITMARTGILLLADAAPIADDTDQRILVQTLKGSDRAARTVCINKQGRVSVQKGDVQC